MNLREAEEKDFEIIYMMGYDAWGDGLSKPDYLLNCKSSIKYANGKWYVLENDDKVLSSSLLIHNLNHLNCGTGLEIRGIGSISTPIHLRRKGYGSNLIEKTISYINRDIPIDIWFLYSDIGADFYNKLKFEALPNNFQKRTSSLLMAYCQPNTWDINTNAPQIEIPNYF
ncbi:GNAT family N-acetyltransferase [Clostridium beijerinckii]|uniref:GNAT family N-acetyltransferase n=1 Tax=Clostridium beijerinckii TaxID=1520 RepID=UPI00232DFCC3|nr:GNAT family N-acetyltransferase [Clostridium beijerinckii]